MRLESLPLPLVGQSALPQLSLSHQPPLRGAGQMTRAGHSAKQSPMCLSRSRSLQAQASARSRSLPPPSAPPALYPILLLQTSTRVCIRLSLALLCSDLGSRAVQCCTVEGWPHAVAPCKWPTPGRGGRQTTSSAEVSIALELHPQARTWPHCLAAAAGESEEK